MRYIIVNMALVEKTMVAAYRSLVNLNCKKKKKDERQESGLHNNPRKKGDFEHKYQYPLPLFVKDK